MMRALLGAYIGCNPREIAFSYSPYGKPGLSGDHQFDLQFNLSHSHELVVLGVTHKSRIGIDVEFIHPNAIEGSIQERVFSPWELVVFKNLPQELKLRGFLSGWTRKEAFIKARGEGLAMPLHLFDVSLDPRQPARLVCIRPDDSERQHWKLQDLEFITGYVGALAVERRTFGLKRYTWPDDLGYLKFD